MYTGCLKIREFRIQSVVGDHFSSSNKEMVIVHFNYFWNFRVFSG
jgi:hypothetical protein